MAAQPQSRQSERGSERRIDPRTNLIYLKVDEKGSVVTIRPLGSPDERTVSYGTWITWERHNWKEGS